MATSARTIGIIDLIDNREVSRLDGDPQDLAAALRWLVGESDHAAHGEPARSLLSGNSGTVPLPTTFHVDADLQTIYSQLEDEYQRLLPC